MTHEPARGAAPLPPKPNYIEGRAQVTGPDGSLTVAGQPIALAGLQIRPTSDFAARMQGWIDRNGGTLRCIPGPRGYTCFTRPGADLGWAVLISGFASITPDAPDVYKNIDRFLQVRALVFGSSPSPALLSLIAGTANPSCQNSLRCIARYRSVGYRRINDAFARKDWRALADSVVDINYRNDIDFLYLGYAAEDMGAYNAAAIYYQKALALAQSQNPNDHCASIGPDVCNGIDVSAVTPAHLDTMTKLAPFIF